MRPVEKFASPSIVTLPNGSQLNIQTDYDPYQHAKPVLVANMGTYCSYCEGAVHQERMLQVEHVQPKGLLKYDSLKTKWSNFLLSCPTCNGMDNKGIKDVMIGDVHLPHLNNTFLSLRYDAGGVVEVNPLLKGLSYQHAEALWELVGLNKTAKTSSSGDTRWRKRTDDWNLANIYLLKYKSGHIDVDTLMDIVKGRGGWSIWYTVFRGEDAVLERLISDFEGTAKSCFDCNNHFAPIPRCPQNQNDPI